MANDDATFHPEDETDEGSGADLLTELRAITDVDHKRLLILAQYWWKRFALQFRYAEPEDLIQEAVVRVLGDRRKVPDGVKLTTFLNGIMKSIASHSVEKAEGSDRLHGDAVPYDQRPAVGDTVSWGGAPPAGTSESRLLARDSLNQIDDLLTDDPELRGVLELKAQRWKKAEIKAELGLDETEWENSRSALFENSPQLSAQESQNDPEQEQRPDFFALPDRCPL